MLPDPVRRGFLRIGASSVGVAAATIGSGAFARPFFADQDSAAQGQQEYAMKIVKMEAIALSAALDTNQIKLRAISRKPERHAILLRLTDEDGRVGETFSVLWGADHSQVITWLGHLEGRVLGTPSFLTEDLWERMFEITRYSGWERALAMRAVSIIDCALWDLRGKQLERPLYKVWGAYRSKLPMVVMDSQWYAAEPMEAVTERSKRYLADGYAGLKLKVGASSRLGPEADADRMLAIREAVGPDFRLYADANQGWTIDEAKVFADRCADAKLTWFEEPCVWSDDKKSLARFRTMCPFPLAAGQMEASPEGCRDLMAEGAIDVCNLDVHIGGGATGWRRMAHIAQTYGVQVTTHMDPQVGGHLAASVSNGVHIETYEEPADPFYFKMVQNRPLPENGWLTLGDEPGWGWVLDSDFVAHHRVN